MKIEVVWQDDDLMVVNKPAGLLTLNERGVRGQSVQALMEKLIDKSVLESSPVFAERAGIAHRLDRETSGALLVAKNPESLRFVMKQFKDRRVGKEYWALVHGWIEPKEGRVKLPLSNMGAGDVRQGVRYDGKMADTAWKTIDRFSSDEGKFSLLRLEIRTGRTHQIRAHLAHLGYPIFADAKYLSNSQARLDRQTLRRQFLHAKKIRFDRLTGRKQEVVVGLPNELVKLVNDLSGYQER